MLPAPSEDLERSVAAWRPHDAAARMGGRPAHEEVLDRRPILSPARHRPKEQQLFERELTLKDVALGQTPLALQIERRHDLTMDDEGFEIRRIFRQRVDHRVAEPFTMLIPRSLLQRVRRVL